MNTITLTDTIPKKSKYTKSEIYNIIKTYYLNNTFIEPDESDKEWVEGMTMDTRFALIENFVPESPGWSGDVLFILPPGGLEVANVITLNDKVVNKEIYSLELTELN